MYALVFGKNSEGFANDVMKTSDIKDVRGFPTIGDFLSVANRQGLRFKRVALLVSAVQMEQEFVSLSRYCKEVSPSTEVVILVRQVDPNDRVILDSYYSVFTSPLYTDYALAPNESATTYLLISLVKETIDTLRVNHSMNRGVKPVVKMTQMEEPVEAPKVSKPSPIKTKSGIVKSFSYGGKFFGKKKYTKAQLSDVIALEREANVIFTLMGGH